MQLPKSEINPKENQLVFYLNAKVYSLDSIYAAAYVFIDRAYVFLGEGPKKEVIVSLKGKKKLGKKQLENLQGEFLNELLSSLLRGNIFQKNKKILEYIVGGGITAALNNRLKKNAGKNNEAKKVEKEIAELKKELEKDLKSAGAAKKAR